MFNDQITRMDRQDEEGGRDCACPPVDHDEQVPRTPHAKAPFDATELRSGLLSGTTFLRRRIETEQKWL